MVAVGETYPAEFFEPLHQMLLKIKVKPIALTSNRRGFPPRHRALSFGITTHRIYRTVGLSAPSKKYPEIYAEMVRLGKIICPYEFESIYLNNNVTCPPHKDTNNVGFSVLVSFGNYTGGHIMIEGKKYDAKYTPILFDGSQLEHWNTDDLVGNKYSLVFFNK
jgi:hypothetical protein